MRVNNTVFYFFKIFKTWTCCIFFINQWLSNNILILFFIYISSILILLQKVIFISDYFFDCTIKTLFMQLSSYAITSSNFWNLCSRNKDYFSSFSNYFF